METARFKKSSGPLTVTISSGFAQPGSYTFLLWEADQSSIVMEKSGDFQTTLDDVYQLPDPASANDERIVDVSVTLKITPPINQYSARVSIKQDGQEIGEDSKSGESDNPIVVVQLNAQLKGE